MALIKCTNCGKDISDKATVCPQCGTAVIKSEMTTDKNVWKCEDCGTENSIENETCVNCGCPKTIEDSPQKVEIAAISVPKIKPKEKTKKYMIISIIAIFSIIVGFIGLKNSSEEKYLTNLKSAYDTMLIGAAEAEEAASLIRRVWYNAIFEINDAETDKYTRDNSYDGFVDDFNDALSKLFSDSEFKAKLLIIETNQEDVAKLMKELQDPPEKYLEAYQATKEFYAAYTTLTNLAINPSGNIYTYTSNFNNADDEALKCLNNLKMLF